MSLLPIAFLPWSNSSSSSLLSILRDNINNTTTAAQQKPSTLPQPHAIPKFTLTEAQSAPFARAWEDINPSFFLVSGSSEFHSFSSSVNNLFFPLLPWNLTQVCEATCKLSQHSQVVGFIAHCYSLRTLPHPLLNSPAQLARLCKRLSPWFLGSASEVNFLYILVISLEHFI